MGVGNWAVTDYLPTAGLGWPLGEAEAVKGPQRPQQGSLSIATFNVLAPCYKRMRNGGREADFPDRMEERARETAAFIRTEVAADIICLQEYYLEAQYRQLFEAEVGVGREYDVIVHPRPNRREGCAVLLRRGMFKVEAVKNMTLSRWGSRVALLVDLKARLSAPEGEEEEEEESGAEPPRPRPHQQHSSNILLLNSHLSFPHNRFGGFACRGWMDGALLVVKAFVCTQAHTHTYTLTPTPLPPFRQTSTTSTARSRA